MGDNYFVWSFCSRHPIVGGLSTVGWNAARSGPEGTHMMKLQPPKREGTVGHLDIINPFNILEKDSSIFSETLILVPEVAQPLCYTFSSFSWTFHLTIQRAIPTRLKLVLNGLNHDGGLEVAASGPPLLPNGRMWCKCSRLFKNPKFRRDHLANKKE